MLFPNNPLCCFLIFLLYPSSIGVPPTTLVDSHWCIPQSLSIPLDHYCTFVGVNWCTPPSLGEILDHLVYPSFTWCNPRSSSWPSLVEQAPLSYLPPEFLMLLLSVSKHFSTWGPPCSFIWWTRAFAKQKSSLPWSRDTPGKNMQLGIPGCTWQGINWIEWLAESYH